ncbi:P-loop containing nucleoside triphosphate hydrolase protein [Dactylonectria macrodidyma]|uniref:P-loop containing nucleoside triphosphate hydrolase protein n=1 Tax=Dactylonectria macrodidyma TaxID=307937 RepID=A0A9P9FS27_9HYPO|nr:P-loop containing nucleoside triphosphate hydrolase protein [Dactylonectria macrodidyma]
MANNDVETISAGGQARIHIGNNYFGGQSLPTGIATSFSSHVNDDNTDDCQRIAIHGLGGIGKTQIALEVAFQVRDQHPDCSIFWVPAVDAIGFENAYRDIGRRPKVAGIDGEKADVKSLVKTALERTSQWLLVVDNADDTGLLFGNTTLSKYLPSSPQGYILFTTRNRNVVVQLDIRGKDTIAVEEMSSDEALELLKCHLHEDQMKDTEVTLQLLKFLTYLPLAIRQASAFTAQTGMTTTKYLGHCESSNNTLVRLLSKTFEDRRRNDARRNPITMTWLISFEHIFRDYPLATQYLRLMSFLAEKNIHASLLPPAQDELEADEAIGALKPYSLITQWDGQDAYDIHRLRGEHGFWAARVMERLSAIFISPKYENPYVRIRSLPHLQHFLEVWNDVHDGVTEPLYLSVIATSLYWRGEYEEEEKTLRQALEQSAKRRKSLLGTGHPSALEATENLSTVLVGQGRYQESEQLLREVLRLKMSVLGIERPETFASMSRLALIVCLQRKYEMAKPLMKQTVQTMERTKLVIATRNKE